MPSTFRPAALAGAVLVLATSSARAQSDGIPTGAESEAKAPITTLAPVTVRPSADASAGGLKAPYAGGQVARGGRVGILGSQDMMDTPFSITSYTNELIQDRQAKSVGDMLQNDPTVRMARGFGNFQESYFIRGFILGSDDVAYNGLYSLLPRQYIAIELFERVELVRGATAFLNGASPGGYGIGGAINLLPIRATNIPLTRVTAGASNGVSSPWPPISRAVSGPTRRPACASTRRTTKATPRSTVSTRSSTCSRSGSIGTTAT